MQLTRHTVSTQLLAYLNDEITLAQLVDWAETFFIDGWIEPESDTALVRDVIAHLAAADTAAFPLTWDICQDFMRRLGTPVRVIPLSA